MLPGMWQKGVLTLCRLGLLSGSVFLGIVELEMSENIHIFSSIRNIYKYTFMIEVINYY